jgi:integrase
MTRKASERSSWGTVIANKDKFGSFVSWSARYYDPVSNKRVQRNFKKDQKSLAYAWLDEEQHLAELAEKRLQPWVSWRDRQKAAQAAETSASATFEDYAKHYLDEFLQRDGTPVKESTMRTKRNHVRQLNAYFGKMRLKDITSDDIDNWLRTAKFDGDAGHARRRAYIELKAIMRKACTATDKHPAIIDHNPCTRPAPKIKKSKQAEIPPASSSELAAIYDAMPDYSRIAVYIGATLGLRISEICALQRKDLDLPNKIIYIRHGLQRGKGDVGAFHLSDTKTESSRTSKPMPDALIPLLSEHLRRFCEPEQDAQVIKPKFSAIMSPNSLRGQFDKARNVAGRPDLHFHTLRATAITTAVRQGGSTKQVQDFGRHAKLEDSQIYQHFARADEVQLVNKIADVLIDQPNTLEGLLLDKNAIVSRIEELSGELDTIEAEISRLQQHDSQ